MTNFIQLVGKIAEDEEFVTVLDSLAPIRQQDDPPDRRYVGSPDRGVDFLIEEDRVVAVQIFLKSTGSFAPFAGDLPLGIRVGMQASDIHELLGDASTADRISSKYIFLDLGVKVVITYDDESTVRLLSISGLPDRHA